MNLREQYVAFLTIVRKEIKRYLRIWTQTLLPSAITMSLYFVIFGSLIGSRIGDMGGFTYMQFVVPGLIMMAIVTNSYSNVVSSFYRLQVRSQCGGTAGLSGLQFRHPDGLCGRRSFPWTAGRGGGHARITVFYPSAHSQLCGGGGCCPADIHPVSPWRVLSMRCTPTALMIFPLFPRLCLRR